MKTKEAKKQDTSDRVKELRLSVLSCIEKGDWKKARRESMEIYTLTGGKTRQRRKSVSQLPLFSGEIEADKKLNESRRNKAGA
jgi:hypothetical protein